MQKNLNIKGVAVVLILVHHLFTFDTRINNVNYITIFNLGNQTIENCFEIFSIIYIPIYVFISGYGLYYYYYTFKKENVEYKDIFKKY